MVAEESAIIEEARQNGNDEVLKTKTSKKKGSHKKGTAKGPANKGAASKEHDGSTTTKPANRKKKGGEYKPRLLILMPGDPGYDDELGAEDVALLDPEFAEKGDEAPPEPELTQAEICELLKAVAHPETPMLKQFEVLTKLGTVLDAGGAWLRIRPVGMKTRPMTVREFLMAELLQIRNKYGRLRCLQLNEAQKDYHLSHGKRSIILKARQLGMTTYVAARFFINCITRPGTLAVQVAHDQRSAEEIFRIVHRMLENLPGPLRNGALKTSRANVRQIVFPELDSEYRVETAADPNAGRGLTIQNLHCSEVARWPRDIAETLASLRAAVPPDGEIVLESTPSGAAGTFYQEWQSAVDSGYTRHFYPWWYDQYYRRKMELGELTEEEIELKQKHNLDDEQIAFRREIQTNFGRRAREEYAEDAKSCFLSSGDCVFDVDLIMQRLELPQHIHSKADNSRLLVFLPPQKEKNYIIGVDPAGGGTEGDYACAQVIDRDSGLQCAELIGHYAPSALAHQVVLLAREYNLALVAVERNNHGHEVIGDLMRILRYDHMYPMGKEAGWLTTQVSKPRLVGALSTNFRAFPQMFHSHRLLEQMRTFVLHADRTMSAARGCYDDAVMAMGIALAVQNEVLAAPYEIPKRKAA